MVEGGRRGTVGEGEIATGQPLDPTGEVLVEQGARSTSRRGDQSRSGRNEATAWAT